MSGFLENFGVTRAADDPRPDWRVLLSACPTLSIAETGRLLRRTNSGIYKMVADGRLRAISKGGRLRVLSESIIDFLSPDDESEAA